MELRAFSPAESGEPSVSTFANPQSFRGSYLEVHSNCSQVSTELLIGEAIILISRSKFHSQLPLAYVKLMLLEAIHRKRIRFYFNPVGMMVGYVIWALPEGSVLQRIVFKQCPVIFPNEWDGGRTVVIVDFLAPVGNLTYILRDMRDSLFRAVSSVVYPRIKAGKLILKEVSRDSKSHFFSQQTG